MFDVVEHSIVNIAPTFPSRYTHDLAEVLSYLGERKEVYDHACIETLKANLLENFRLPRNNAGILDAGVKLIGYKAQKYKYDKDYDGTSPETGGFDCSGFICYILDSLGIERPAHIRHCREFFFDIYDFGESVKTADALPGDLIFFSWFGDKVNHIGVYLGEFYNERYYIHATNAWGKVIVSKVSHMKNGQDKMFTENPIGYKRVI